MNNPYQTPVANLQDAAMASEVRYAGFWMRTAASIIDSILILMVTWPMLIWVYGLDYFTDARLFKGLPEVLISYVLPAIAVIVFWIYRSATPGKMALSIRIADARTGAPCSTGQLIGRYFAYYVSMLPLMLGFIWVGIDKRKQGWHDKLAGTVVVRD